MPKRLTEADRDRGRRLLSIREALQLSQNDIVDRLNAAAKTLGLAADYRYYKVSRMESGSISFEDAAVWLAIDPQRRSWEWFIHGEPKATARPVKNVDPALARPVPKREATPQRKAK